MYKRKVPNPYKIVLDFNSSNLISILANSSFESINFAHNRDNKENSTSETIYKSNNQIFETGTNIEYKLIKKKQLTFKEKQVRIAQK